MSTRGDGLVATYQMVEEQGGFLLGLSYEKNVCHVNASRILSRSCIAVGSLENWCD